MAHSDHQAHNRQSAGKERRPDGTGALRIGALRLPSEQLFLVAPRDLCRLALALHDGALGVELAGIALDVLGHLFLRSLLGLLTALLHPFASCQRVDSTRLMR